MGGHYPSGTYPLPFLSRQHGPIVGHHRTHVKTRSGRRQTSAAVALHRSASMSSWIDVQCRAAVHAFSPRVQCTAAALPAPCMIHRADGRTPDEAPSDSVHRCMHHAETLRFSSSTLYRQRRGAASPTLPADLRDLAAHPVDAMHGTRTRTPVAAAGLAGRGRVRAHGGRAGVRAWHLRTVRRAAPHVASSQPSPARAGGPVRTRRAESNRANCLFHQCRS